MRRSIGKAAWVVLVSTLGLVLPHAGWAEPERVHIDYAPPVGCPDAVSFLRSLRARTSRFRQAAAAEPARRFRVRIASSGGDFVGTLEIRGLEGSTAIRRVDAKVCDEVVNALALMTALAIDPKARTLQPATIEPSINLPATTRQTTTEPAEPMADAAPPESAEPADSEMDPAALRLARPRVAVPPAQQKRPPTPPWRWSAGLHGHVTYLSPALGYGGDLFVDTEAPPSSTLGPALRLGVFFDQIDVELAPRLAARFWWAAAGLEGCLVRMGMARGRLVLHPCIGFRLGALHGEGRQISHPQEDWSLWAEAELGLRLRVAATEHLMVEAQSQLVMPLHRPTFVIWDENLSRLAYSMPHLGVTAGIGAAYRFR